MKIKRIIDILCLKWLEGDCPHICIMCRYNSNKPFCISDMNNIIEEIEQVKSTNHTHKFNKITTKV